MTDVSIKDFQPINTWKLDLDGPKWFYSNEPRYIIDTTTDRRYWNESKGCVGFKCFLLTLGTPIVHPIAAIVNIAIRVLKILSLSHFWLPTSHSLKGRLKDVGQDLLKILISPLVIPALELAAIYGMVTPYDGRKLYASIERAIYGSFILAPCFQPDPEIHAFGGNPLEQNAY